MCTDLLFAKLYESALCKSFQHLKICQNLKPALVWVFASLEGTGRSEFFNQDTSKKNVLHVIQHPSRLNWLPLLMGDLLIIWNISTAERPDLV